MKVFQIAAVTLLTLPTVAQASSGPHHAKPPAPPTIAPGPINGTVINPGPGRINGTVINPGPINGTVINPGTVPGPGPINGTVINPGASHDHSPPPHHPSPDEQ